MQISSFISDSYSINLCLGYQLCLNYLLIPLHFYKHLHRYPGIFLPNVWTLPSESCLPFCLEQVYSYLCGQGGDVTPFIKKKNISTRFPQNIASKITEFIVPKRDESNCFADHHMVAGEFVPTCTNVWQPWDW